MLYIPDSCIIVHNYKQVPAYLDKNKTKCVIILNQIFFVHFLQHTYTRYDVPLLQLCLHSVLNTLQNYSIFLFKLTGLFDYKENLQPCYRLLWVYRAIQIRRAYTAGLFHSLEMMNSSLHASVMSVQYVLYIWSFMVLLAISFNDKNIGYHSLSMHDRLHGLVVERLPGDWKHWARPRPRHTKRC